MAQKPVPLMPVSPSPQGYSNIASRMGSSPQFAIFRKFASLNTKNLLYLQAELTVLEKKLEEYVKEDQKSINTDRSIYERDWETLKTSSDPGATANGHNPKQWQTFLEIRKKLKEYNEALFLQSEILKLQQPNPPDLKSLKMWMGSTEMGNVFLLGPDSDIWDEENLDHVALKMPTADDPVAKWIIKSAAQKYHYLIGHYFRKPKLGQDPSSVVYSDEGIASFTRAVTTLLSCLLPVIAVVILYFEPDLPKRLGILAGLVAAFAICLLKFTNANGGDIFAASAAFTAVLVVFVGSTSASTAPTPAMAYLYNCTSLDGKCTAIVQ